LQHLKDPFGAPDRFRAFFMERYGDCYRLEIEACLNRLAQRKSAPVNATDGLRAAYLAEAAGAPLRLGKTIELKPNCEITWQ
jgi:myo-inositol 2-dehydrogenase / D-chiro-inositol 1-dehydrogenase